MGKATGFMEFARALPILRPPLDRVGDWNEFHEHSPESTLRQQGARCMDCGVPFCHTGELMNGSASGCPLNNLIPEWNHLVYSGNWRAALDLLHKTNNFPEFTGRVCPAPCEGSCVLGINDDPVAIKSIECAIVDRGFDEGWIVPEPPMFRTGKRVAIVGSGPAGLACAAQLNKLGHRVRVFEKSNRVGGLLMYGIPNMKLDKGIVQRRVDLLSREGIEFCTNIEIGRDYSSIKLKEDFDVVVLCGGASKPRDLSIPGRHLDGIHFAMDFLRANTQRVVGGTETNYISAEGKDVIVIGGGDTGTDCIATSLRQGCRSLIQFEILPQPHDARTNDNPWPQWPRVHRVDYGHEETIAAHGSDPRQYCLKSTEFIGNASGAVEAIRSVDVGWEKPSSGTPILVDHPNTERIWRAQLVLLAMGFDGAAPEGPVSELGLALTPRQTIAVDNDKMTNVPGVFAAGDIERGQSLVVWAIADGRRAASHVNRYLTN